MILPISELPGYLKDTAKRVATLKLRKPLTSAREKIRDGVAEAFATQTSPAGEPWLPVKRPVPPPALDVTGYMKSSALDSLRVARVTDDGLVAVCADPPYTIFQDEGTAVIPARHFYGVSDEVVSEVADDCADQHAKFILGDEP